MNCTVLGGGGFIGSAITDRLLMEGHRVKVLIHSNRPPYRPFSPKEPIQWISGDFANEKHLKKVMNETDVVFHLVCSTLPKSSNEHMVHDVESNLIGSLRFLQAARAVGVRKIIFISSGGTVYGHPTYLPIDESHPTNPIVSYGITKLAIEKYILMYVQLYDLQAIILRVSNPYGERQRIETAQGAVGVFLKRALAGEPIEIWGDGTTTRDYIHVSDVATAFTKASTYDGPHRVLNVSTSIGTSLNDLVKLIQETVGRPIQVKYRESRVFDVPANVLDNSLIKQEFGWSPQIDLRKGILKTIEWYSKQRTDSLSVSSKITD
jgi:UDP-glucose 4-epimerase